MSEEKRNDSEKLAESIEIGVNTDPMSISKITDEELNVAKKIGYFYATFILFSFVSVVSFTLGILSTLDLGKVSAFLKLAAIPSISTGVGTFVMLAVISAVAAGICLNQVWRMKDKLKHYVFLHAPLLCSELLAKSPFPASERPRISEMHVQDSGMIKTFTDSLYVQTKREMTKTPPPESNHDKTTIEEIEDERGNGTIEIRLPVTITQDIGTQTPPNENVQTPNLIMVTREDDNNVCTSLRHDEKTAR